MIGMKIILLLALATVEVTARPSSNDKPDNGYIFLVDEDTGKAGTRAEVKLLAIKHTLDKTDSPDNLKLNFEIGNMNGFIVKGLTATDKKALEEKMGSVGRFIPNTVFNPELPTPEDVRKAPTTKSSAAATCNSKCCKRAVSKANNGNLDWLSSGADGYYCAAATAATRMQVFVLDTGVDATHPDFKGRAFAAYDCASTGPTPWTPFKDIHGHGTHVSGTIGSETYGVTPNANISHIKVLNDQGSGTVGSLLCGFNYVKAWLKANPTKKAVMSMSLGFGSTDDTIDAAATQLTNTFPNQLVIVAAAGNSGDDACGYTLPVVDNLIAVGSVDNSLVESYFSNYGACVDILAPGENVLSLQPGNKVGSMSGTSMATPLVAGAIAQYWLDYPTNTGSSIRKSIMSGTSPVKTINGFDTSYGTPNKLISYTCLVKC